MKIRHVDISEIEASPISLLREVEETGESLVITRNGTPVLEVHPYRQTEHVAKKDWQSFFELVKKTEVPNNFLSRCERQQGVMSDKILDEAIREAIENMPVEQRKKLLAEAIEKAELTNKHKR
jgi:prevent-host-death family protein